MPKNTNPQKSAPTPKAFDVFKPGKALAPPTSRPVIARRKPAVHDSMFTDKPGKLVPNARNDRELLDPHDKVTVDSPAEETVSEPTVPQPPVPNESLQSPVEEAMQAQATDEPELTAETSQAVSENTEAAVEHEPASISQTGERTPPAAEHPEPAVNVEASSQESVPPALTVDTSQIVVSHHKPVGGSKWKSVIITLTVLVLAIAAADVALDTGVWTPNYNIPHTHLLGH